MDAQQFLVSLEGALADLFLSAPRRAGRDPLIDPLFNGELARVDVFAGVDGRRRCRACSRCWSTSAN
jgi:hypothetical protein